MFQSLDEVPTACTTIEEVGSTGVGALTVAFLILIIATIIFLIKGWSSPEQKRLRYSIFSYLGHTFANDATNSYYVCSSYICGFAAMAYFAMLSGQGWTAIAGCRQFFYARYLNRWIKCNQILITFCFRYADWIVSFPLLILLLGIVANADTPSIGAGIGAIGDFSFS
jgi:bacteriorhodopsin